MINSQLIRKLRECDTVILSTSKDFTRPMLVSPRSIGEMSIELNNTHPEGRASLLFRNSQPQSVYESILLEGEIKENSFIIHSQKGWQVHNSDFIGYVQSTLSADQGFMESYNENIFRQLVKLEGACHIISAVGGVIHSKPSTYSFEDGTFIVPVAQTDFVYRQLKANPRIRLLISTQEYNNINIDCIVQTERTQNNIAKLRLKPIRMTYGDQTELETYYFDKKGSVVEDIRIFFSSRLHYTKESVRWTFLLTSLLPILLGISIAFFEGYSISKSVALLTLLGFALVQVGLNRVTEYFDNKQRKDTYKLIDTPLSGGRYIFYGLHSPESVLIQAIVLIILAASIGLYLNSVVSGNVIIGLSILGGLIAYSYSGYPLQLSYKGLGEILILIIFGPLPTFAAWFLQSKSFVWNISLLLGLIPGIFSAIYVTLNNIADLEADVRIGKNTLVEMLGRGGAVKLARLSALSPLALIIILVITQINSPILLISMLTIPVVYKFIQSLSTKQLEKNTATYLLVYHISFMLIVVLSLILLK
ncbi:MAG: prenyltransferase [Candidatus Heimdallarchaeota archaeon]|nr:prenyltransferase [Candidatus Heimdallarchaeota archaeon]